jgi:lipopolysaccharide transport system ATP-binding protein
MQNFSIRVQNLGVEFFLKHEEERSRHTTGVKGWFGKKSKEIFWALKDITFSANKGEIFGIIGSNGAGKSTLLKAIAGIIPTTTGEVATTGRIAPLIELGAAFNPELTGAENIFLTGSIYKIPKTKIRRQFDSIVNFSGLRKFIDIPVKNYSSGMFIRLAFSIIMFFQPDVVLIDEVFSVGDEVFQKKSFEKIISFKQEGATILLVTHDANLISQICDRAMVLSEGRMSFIGPAAEAVGHYHHLINLGEGLEGKPKTDQKKQEDSESKRWGTKQIEITNVEFVDDRNQAKKKYRTGDYFEARVSYISRVPGLKPVFGISINTIYKLLIFGPNTQGTVLTDNLPPKGTVRFIVPRLPLLDGDYLFSAAVYDEALKTPYDHHDLMYHFQVDSGELHEFGSVRLESNWRIEED